MSSIPEVLYHDILLKVPVKSLLVCKCVCKSWLAIISNPDFVKSHLDLAIQRNNPNFLVMNYNVFRTINYDSLTSSTTETGDDPLNLTDKVVRLWGSCNGLVFLQYYFGTTGSWDNYCLLNLATREYKMIVVPQDPDELCICGLGYDCNTNDYKLIVSDGCYDKISVIKVYSLASDSWKSIPITIPYTFPYRSYILEQGVLFNGYLHWLALNQSISKVIVSFDMSNESFKEVQLPDESWKYGSQAIFLESLGVSEGRLCVVKKDYFGPDARLEFWEMLDYGVEESWTRRYIITHESILMDNNFRMMWSFENGKFLFLSTGTLALYDPEDGSVRGLNNKHDIYFMDGASYFESMVSLKSGTYFGGDGRIEELREP